MEGFRGEPKVALIDGDILPYEFGNMTMAEDETVYLSVPILRTMIKDRIQGILEMTGCTEYEVYLTHSASNFRNRVATIKPYKGHRPTEKPYNWQEVRDLLIEEHGAEEVEGIEADDKLSIRCCELGTDSVLCSRDKDLKMVPGNHYVWPCGSQKQERFYQTELDGLKCFYKQLLTGDSTDNILGLYGVGSKSSLVKKVEECEDEYAMFELVYKAYLDRFGTYAGLFMNENAALLWMLREYEFKEHPELEIISRFAPMYVRYIEEHKDGD